MINNKLVVSLFCGVGGLCLGFKENGFEIAIAIDNNPKVIEIYKSNFPYTTALCLDINNITGEEIKDIIKTKYKNWDGAIAAVIGGPPCQGFSIGGKQRISDERNKLIIKFMELVQELNPAMFVMENVPAIECQKFSHLTSAARAIAESNYFVSRWMLTASDYGVPQKRKRAIWVGSKLKKIEPPTAYEKSFMVSDAIADLETIPIKPEVDIWDWYSKRGEKCEYSLLLDKVFPRPKMGENSLTGCRATVHSPQTKEKYENTSPGEKEPTTWAYKLDDNGYAPTLRAGSGNRTAARPIHYKFPRVITVREAARLHSFPDWFDFGQTKLLAHKAIGNSVPPLMAYAIASRLICIENDAV